MSEPPYRALRIVLGFLSLLLALGGLLLIFSSRGLILRVFMHPPESEISTLLLAAVKEMGGIVLTLSVMLFLAARDPERNVAIIDGMTLGLCILAITPLVSLYTLDIRRLYPGYLIWVRSLCVCPARYAQAEAPLYLRLPKAFPPDTVAVPDVVVLAQLLGVSNL